MDQDASEDRNWHMLKESPDYASRVEWDLLVALSAAVGVERTRSLRVFSRYSLNKDSMDLLVGYDGSFYEFVAINTHGRAYLQELCDLVKRMLERH